MGTEQESLQHFQSIPWCAELIKDEAFKVTPTRSRRRKDTTEDELFAETLNTKDTIAAFITMCKMPKGDPPRIDEARIFLQLGYGLNGYPHVCHGGMVSMIMDEAMGTLLSVNKDLETDKERDTIVTANLNITYIKPVRTPAAIVATSRFKEISGRKHIIEAIIAEDGVVLAKAEALWIAVARSKTLKL